MKAYQIFQAVSPELGRTLFQNLRDDHRDAYKGVLVSLAAKRRLRPVFLQRKPVPQQIDWLYKTCQLRPVNDLAENTLQVWLLKSQKAMLVQFLDQLGVEHDENGTVEDLPETLDDKKLQAAIDSLLKDFPAEPVSLYLNVFQLQRSGGWDNLKKLLESDPRLLLPRAVRIESPAEEQPEAPSPVEAEAVTKEEPQEAPVEAAPEADAPPKKKRASRKRASAPDEAE